MKEFEEQIFLLNDKSSVSRLVIYSKQQRKPFFNGVAYSVNQMLKLVS